MHPRTQQITSGRLELLRAVDEYGYLTYDQLYRLLPAEGAATRATWERGVRRMAKLFCDAGYLTFGTIEQRGKSRRGGFSNSPYVFFLTRKGATALAAARSSESMPSAPHHERKPASLVHEVERSELHLRLKQGLALYPHLRLHSIHHELKRGTNPDWVFGIEDTRRPRERSTFWFFVEIEKSRQGHWFDGKSQLMQKLERYATYRRSQQLRADWRYISDFRLIVQVETAERAMNLLKKTARCLPQKFIWITSAELTKANVLGAIFRTPQDYREKAYSVLTL